MSPTRQYASLFANRIRFAILELWTRSSSINLCCNFLYLSQGLNQSQCLLLILAKSQSNLETNKFIGLLHIKFTIEMGFPNFG